MAELKKFAYTARNQSGEVVSGSEEAENSDILLNRLQGRGLLVTDISLYSAGQMPVKRDLKKADKALKFKHSSVNQDDMILFARQLATALGSGVPLLKSLQIISNQLASKRLYQTTRNIIHDIESGLSLRDALSRHPKIFTGAWINLVETGEASGNLQIVLDKLAYYLEKRAAFKSKIVSAMIYPVILMFVSIGAIVVFLLAIVPRFAEIFQGLNISLPPVTQMLISFSGGLRKTFPLQILILFGSIFMYKLYVKSKNGKRFIDNLIFKIPVLNEFFKLTEIEKFCSGMATLLESGVPILYALEISERSSDNVVVQDILRDVKTAVRDGKPLLDPLEASEFFPPMVTQMVGMGEEIGELDKMFKRISGLYSEMLETQIGRFTSMFEPLMIVFMGFIIGTMVIAMFLPIFKIAQIGSG